MDSYTENKDFNNWLQSHMDPNKAESIRQQFTDFGNFTMVVREKRKTKQTTFRYIF